MTGFQNVVRWLKTRSSGRSKSGRRRTLGPDVLDESIASWSGKEQEKDCVLQRSTPVRRSLPPIPRSENPPTRSRRKSPDRSRFRARSSSNSGSSSVYEEIPAWAVSDAPRQRTCISLPGGDHPFVRNAVHLESKRKVLTDQDSADEFYEYDVETASRASKSENDDVTSRRSRRSVARSLSNSSSQASSDAGVSVDSGFQDNVVIPDDYVITKPPPVPHRRRTLHVLPTSPPNNLTSNERYLLATVSCDLTDKLNAVSDQSDHRQCVNIPQRVDSSPSRRPTLGVSAMCIKKKQLRSIDGIPPSLQQYQNSLRKNGTPSRKLSLPVTPSTKPSNVMTPRGTARRQNSLLQDLMRVNHDRQNMMM